MEFQEKFSSEDRTFPQALQETIADEVAAKETIQVQQQQLSQPLNSVTKDPFTLRSSCSENPRTRQRESTIVEERNSKEE